jgi:hypothetical protein
MDFSSQFISNDFPIYTQLNGPNLVAFIRSYYEWLEQSGNTRYYGNKLRDNRDIDESLQEFITHFQYEYINQLPANIVASKPLLIKHILDLYKAKGTKRGFELLFRIIFNEDVDIYLSGNDVFKPSAAQWIQPKYIEISDCSFIDELVGKSIYSLNGKATALVESCNIVRTSNKVINVLFLSSVAGSFIYGDIIMSNEVDYSTADAPFIVGSLSSVSIENGGTFYNIGDIVSISGSGSGALGRISSVTSENGKVVFTLVDGGYGFSMNAQIQIIGGIGGSGANFSVGSLSNQSVYRINTDIIKDYWDEQLDVSSSGFKLNFNNTTGGGFLAGEVVNCNCSNSVDLDFKYLSGSGLEPFEQLSNTSLGISVESIIVDNPNYARVIGTDANLIKLGGGQTLVSNITSSVIYVNSTTPKQQNFANGIIQSTDQLSRMVISGDSDNYPLVTSTVTGVTSHTSANVWSVTRLTDWGFPSYLPLTNLDTPIELCLNWKDMVIGTIASLSNINPGDFYSSNPTVVITEPNIAALAIEDGKGGYWGNDALVTANAIFANGIATSVQIISSGFGFAKGETLELSSANNTSSIKAVAITQGTGVSQGYWRNNPSGTSDTSHIMDSYYYQPYSYELSTGRAISSYRTLVESLMGPIGYVMFGKYMIKDEKENISAIEYESFTQYIFYNFYVEELTVTSTNTLSAPTYYPNGSLCQLYVNGLVYQIPLVQINSPNTIVWNNPLFNLEPTDLVIFVYNYITEENNMSAYNIYSEKLTVSSTNTLSHCTYTPNGILAQLSVNGISYFNVGTYPSFTLNGTTITWSPTNTGFDINTSDIVYINYTYTD